MQTTVTVVERIVSVEKEICVDNTAHEWSTFVNVWYTFLCKQVAHESCTTKSVSFSVYERLVFIRIHLFHCPEKIQ